MHPIVVFIYLLLCPSEQPSFQNHISVHIGQVLMPYLRNYIGESILRGTRNLSYFTLYMER